MGGDGAAPSRATKGGAGLGRRAFTHTPRREGVGARWGAYVPRGGPTGTLWVCVAQTFQFDTVIEPISMMVRSPWKRLLKISCSQTVSPSPSPHFPPPPRRSLFGSAQPPVQGSRRPRRRSLPTRDGGRGAGGLRPEGAAALSPTPGALQGRGRGRRRGARWEMQSSPSERLNPGRGGLLLASEDLFFFFSSRSHRACGTKRKELLSFDFQESRGIGPARANTGARLRRWF